MSECPYCGATVATVADEVAHMNAEHPEVIVERLRKAGLHAEADDLQERLDAR